jgi:hypothetical protein
MTDNDLKAIREIVRSELQGYATKNDLKDFATKNDIKRFATKGDLHGMEGRLESKFATKGDLHGMEGRLESKVATKDDFKRLEAMVAGIGDRTIAIANSMATSEDVDELKECIDGNLDDLELRLGRRIDDLMPSARPRRPKKRNFISAKA